MARTTPRADPRSPGLLLRAGPILCVGLLAAGLFSCLTPKTGTMSAGWTATDGKTAGVELTWDEQDDTHGQLFTRLGPEGERFRGKYVQVTAQTQSDVVTPLVTHWAPYGLDNPSDPWWWGPPGARAYGGTYYGGFVSAYTGKVVATLFGDQGNTMRCRFDLVDPTSGLGGGGVGECQTSAGDKLDVGF